MQFFPKCASTHTSTQLIPSQSTPSAGGFQESQQAADRVYQGVTIAAMLLLLVSLWVF
jgi:hypothetical protein